MTTKAEAPITLNTKLYEADRLLEHLNKHSGIRSLQFEFTLFDPSESEVDATIHMIKKFMSVAGIPPPVLV